MTARAAMVEEVARSADVDPTPSLLPSWAWYVAAGLGLTGGVAGALWTALHVRADPVLYEVALFVHLGCLVLGFGAVLTVDWVALQWARGQRNLADVLHAADQVHLPIWLGYAGLVLSGVLLAPDLTSPVTQLKLSLVVVIGWNGLAASWLQRHLRERPRGLALGASLLCASVSQCAWWGAAVIGFVNAR